MAEHSRGGSLSSEGIRSILIAVMCAGLVMCPSGCSRRSGTAGESPAKVSLSQTVLAIRDEHIVCDLPTLAKGSSEGEIDLGVEVSRALVYGEGEAAQLVYETIVDGSTQLRTRLLGSAEELVVAERVTKTVGFDGGGDIYFIEDGPDSPLVRYDAEQRERTVVASRVVDAIVDPRSESFACLETISDQAADPLYTRLMYHQTRLAKPVEVDHTDNLRFHTLAFVTPRVVAYVENPGGGEQHGNVWLFDAATGTKAQVASGARVAAVSPQSDAIVLGKITLSGDVLVDRFGNAATDTESACVVPLVGARVGEPVELRDTEATFIQAVFVGDNTRVAVVSGSGDVGGRVRCFNLSTGEQSLIFETATEGIGQVCAAHRDLCVVCVVGTVDRGGTTWSQEAVVLSVDTPDAVPERIPEEGHNGTIDLVGAANSGEG